MRAVRSCSAILKTWFWELDPNPLHDHQERGIGKKEREHCEKERKERKGEIILILTNTELHFQSRSSFLDKLKGFLDFRFFYFVSFTGA